MKENGKSILKPYNLFQYKLFDGLKTISCKPLPLEKFFFLLKWKLIFKLLHSIHFPKS